MKFSELLVEIVEDDPLNMELLDNFLKAEGFRVIKAATGREAIELAEQSKPDLVLLDVGLPDVTGIEVMKEIKKRNPRVPVFALTAFAMKGDRERMLEAGFDAYFPKPLNFRLLLETIKRILHNRLNK